MRSRSIVKLSRVLSRFHEKLRPDKLSKCWRTGPRTLLSPDAHIEFDTRHKSADDFTGYTTTSILSSHFHRTSVTSVPCFIRACDGCCTNVFIRLNSRVQGFSRSPSSDQRKWTSQGESKREHERGTGVRDEENCAWIVFPLPCPEENL